MKREWTIDVYEFNGKRDVTLRSSAYEVTLEIDRDGDLVVEHEVDSDSYGCGSRDVRCYVPMEKVVEFLRACGYEVRAPGDPQPSEEIHTSPDCQNLPEHAMCWDDASGCARYKRAP